MSDDTHPFRIMLLTETFHPEIGGGERQAALLAGALTCRGHAVTLVTRRSRWELQREETDGNMRVLRIPPAGPRRLKKWGLLITGFIPLVRLREEVDVVFVSGFRMLGVPAIAASRLLSKVCVLKADSNGEMSGEFFRAGLARMGLTPDFPAVRAILGLRNRLLRRADGYVAISSEITQELADHGIAADRVRRIPNGVDTQVFRPASAGEKAELRRRLGLPSGPIAIYTGRLVSYKGLPLLVRVWRALRRMHPRATLLLVGAGGSDIHDCETELRDYVAANGLGAAVLFTGGVDNVHDYLRAADVFVFPTENEAFGLSLVEAMACGLSVVTTPVGAIPEFVVDGCNGLLVEPANFDRLHDALASLVTDRGRAATLGRAARETVIQCFGVDAVADEYVRFFQALLHEHRNRNAR